MLQIHFRERAQTSTLFLAEEFSDSAAESALFLWLLQN